MHAEVNVSMSSIDSQCLFHRFTLAIRFDSEPSLLNEFDFVWDFSSLSDMREEDCTTLCKEAKHLLLEAKLRNCEV